MGIEQLTAEEACIAENEDETLQVTEYLQSPEVEPYIKCQCSLQISSGYL